MKKEKSIIPDERIEGSILLIRGQKVILDSDLAKLYGVTTKRLNEQVKRNKERFPSDFMFRLTKAEFDSLRSQIATSSTSGGRQYHPLVFTEHGAIMAAGVLNSKLAIEVSIFVVRAFVKLREMIISNAELAYRLDEMEKKYDAKFKVVFEAIRQLMSEPKKKKNPIGFN